MVPLLLERATVLHGLGDQRRRDGRPRRAARRRARARRGAAVPRRPRAQRRRRRHAIALWRRYLAVETRPQRRGEIELQLSQVLAENTDDVAGAIEQLERVVEANPDDTQLRERLLGLCMRVSDWERAIRELRQLVRLRPTPPEKAREELRLGLMLRDKISDRVAARLALDRARALDPLNLDVVRELAELLEPAARAQMLLAAATSFRASIVAEPGPRSLYERLAQVTAWQSDVDARWLALVAVEALGTPTVDQRQVLAQGRQQLALPTRVKLDDTRARRCAAASADRSPSCGARSRRRCRSRPASMPASSASRAATRSRSRSSATSTSRSRPRSPRSAIEDVEIYISAGRSGFARALAGETPILVPRCRRRRGDDAATALRARPRGRELAEGVATLPDLRDGELEWTIVAALHAADVAVPPALAELAPDRRRRDRRAREGAEEECRARRAAPSCSSRSSGPASSPMSRRCAAPRSRSVSAPASCGAAISRSRSRCSTSARAAARSPIARRRSSSSAWSVSEDHLKLREKLGVALKGNR